MRFGSTGFGLLAVLLSTAIDCHLLFRHAADDLAAVSVGGEVARGVLDHVELLEQVGFKWK
jgi:hypothetical protein